MARIETMKGTVYALAAGDNPGVSLQKDSVVTDEVPDALPEMLIERRVDEELERGNLSVKELLVRSERLLAIQRSVQDSQRSVELACRVVESGVETLRRMTQASGS